MHASVQSFQNVPAYFATAVSYTSEMFMKSTLVFFSTRKLTVIRLREKLVHHKTMDSWIPPSPLSVIKPFFAIYTLVQ
jgi:hypothetical protein